MNKPSVEKTISSLKKKGYAVSYFSSAPEAADYLDAAIDKKTVGFGDSETILRLGLFHRLNEHNTVFDPMHREGAEPFSEVAKKSVSADIFLTSVNAIAETGEMVNIDGRGNRVAGSIYGHEKVFFILGVNKIEPTLDRAIARARNVAAPLNAKRHGYRTPCAGKADRCYDCASPERICCGMMVYLHKMRFMEMEVVIIDESLGL